MRTLVLKTFLILVVCCHLSVGNTEGTSNSHAAATSVSIGTLSIQPDVAFARSVMGSNLTGIKGAIGESLAESVIQNGDSRGRQWRSITARSGPQGLDHIFIKTDKNGLPCDLMIGETKYDTSRLGNTLDGIQMGSKWVQKRLVSMGNRYCEIASVQDIQYERKPYFCNHARSVILKNGEEVCFWRENAKGAWKFDGDLANLLEAQELAGEYGRFLQGAGNGKIQYKSRIFHITPSESDVLITIYNADKVDKSPSINKLSVTGKFTLKGVMDSQGALSDEACKVIAQKVMSACHFSETEAMEFAKSCKEHMTLRQAVTPYSQARDITINSAAMGMGAIALDAGIQLLVAHEISSTQLAYSGGVAAVGGAITQAIEQYAIRNRMMNASNAGMATTLMSPRNFIRASGVFAAIDIIAGYGLAMGGATSWNDAHHGALASTGALLASVGAYNLLMAAPAAMGAVASTGAGISTLSGAAATNATLAVYGGGAAAAGGGGMTMGALVVGGGVAIAAVAAVYICYKGIQLHEEHQNYLRIMDLADFYSQCKNWEKVLEGKAL